MLNDDGDNDGDVYNDDDDGGHNDDSSLASQLDVKSWFHESDERTFAEDRTGGHWSGVERSGERN